MNTYFRSINTALFAASLFILGFSLFMQYGMGLTPCPLCMLARVLVFFLVIIFLVAALHNPGKRGRIMYAFSSFITCLLGIVVTLRHLWILQLPPEKVPACTPGLDYLLGTLPFSEALLVVLNGSGECAQLDGQFLGVSLPGWTLAVFILLAVGSTLPVFKQNPK